MGGGRGQDGSRHQNRHRPGKSGIQVMEEQNPTAPVSRPESLYRAVTSSRRDGARRRARDGCRPRAGDAGYAADAQPASSPGQRAQLGCWRACFSDSSQEAAIFFNTGSDRIAPQSTSEYGHAHSVRCVGGEAVFEERETCITTHTAANAVPCLLSKIKRH